jgi:hypothetical protein
VDHIDLTDAARAAADQLDAIVDPPALVHDYAAYLIATGKPEAEVRAALLAAHLDDMHRQAVAVACQGLTTIPRLTRNLGITDRLAKSRRCQN